MGEVVDELGDVVFGEDDGEGAERVGLDHVGAHLEDRGVKSLDGIGAARHKDLVTALEGFAAEVVGTEVHQLQVGAGGSVEDEDSISERCEVGVRRRGELGQEGKVVRHDAKATGMAGILGQVQIYTGKGDDGTTGLLYGGRVRKDADPIEVNGAVDEAQAALGLARAHGAGDAELDGLLVDLERDLYVLMAEVATLPENRTKLAAGVTLVTAQMVSALEAEIDRLTETFAMPTEFVVPGQNLVAASLDVARTTVRRAERLAVAAGLVDSFVIPYLNRLSDLVWTMARWQEGEHFELAKARREQDR